jgi:hypothetical protein
MEDYLKQLKPTGYGAYTLPADKFTILLKRYSDMKRDIIVCVKIKKECEILKQDKEHVKSQYFDIQQIKNELESVLQENNKLKIELEKAVELATTAFEELKRVRAKKDSK